MSRLTGLQDSLLVEDAAWFRIDEAVEVLAARRAATELVTRLGFPEARTGEVGIAVTEAGTNLAKHARQGQILLRLRRLHEGASAALEVVVLDSGPGMREATLSATDGHSTAGTLGIGLGEIRRLSSTCAIHSVPGRGTVLVATFRAGADVPADRDVAGITRPMTGEEVCGDGYAARSDGDRTVVMLSDGLGHGPLAARATHEAVRIFRDASDLDPATLLRRMHAGLGHTRGAAISVALIDRRARTLRYAGLGNVSGTLAHAGGRSGLVSHPGIVGHQARTIRETSHALPAAGVLVMHSDGVTDRWSLADYPGLERCDPLLVAATLLRDAGVRRDDATVVAARVA